MCGIAGVVAWQPVPELSSIVGTMTEALARRGPNGAGSWLDQSAGVGLGHRRLAILDLSEQGHQPMVSDSGRFVITFNGVIYNFAELRGRLDVEGRTSAWRGHSDTEVLLACIESWGIERALSCALGMFALALWDRRDRTLILARDRIGEKPLYYGCLGRRFVFASELHAIRRAFPGRLSVDRGAVGDLINFGFIPAPRSIFTDIFKLDAAHFLVVRAANDIGEARPYWKLEQPAELPSAKTVVRPDEEVVDHAHHLIKNAVKQQTVSDVPIAAWLSGGIDSSVVVAALQAQTNRQVQTFTLGFDNPRFDEADHARAVAKQLETDHHELYAGAADATAILPELAEIYSEPFADSSQIPTAMLAKMTSQHVSVVLSGDGGDELFAGYPRYRAAALLWRSMRRFPSVPRRWVGDLLQRPSQAMWDRMLPSQIGAIVNGRRMHRMGRILGAGDLSEMYLGLISQLPGQEGLVRDLAAGPVPHSPSGRSELDTIRRMDLLRYLPDDLLVKTDRATMAVGLECRAPLLDHRLVEFAFALPDALLIRNGAGKWILRRILDQYLPRRLIERPKRGFSAPIGDWLRGPLREWASDLLAPGSVAPAGLLESSKVDAVWRDHLSGKADRSYLLWSILMLQAWQRHHQI